MGFPLLFPGHQAIIKKIPIQRSANEGERKILPLELGAVQARYMTSEAAMTKFMRPLGQGMEQAEVGELFGKNLAGEVTV